MQAAPWAQPSAKPTLKDAAAPVHVKDLITSHASLYQEHSGTLARLSNLQCELKAASSDCATALAQVREMKGQHADAQTELRDTLKELCNLYQEMVKVYQERTALLSELDALRAQAQSHEVLEVEYEHLLRANDTVCSEREQLQADHQELTTEHAALAHSFQQVSNQRKELEQECQQLSARQHEHEHAQEQHRASLAEHKDARQAYSTDLHRLQVEVLVLEDTLHGTKLEHERSKDKLQQQLRQALKQQSEQNSKYEANLQELEKAQAKRQSVELELAGAALKSCDLELVNDSLLHRLQQSQDRNASLQHNLDDASKKLGYDDYMLQVSDSRCAELERQLNQSRECQFDAQSELAELQADLKKLHDLAAGNRLTGEDLHNMFAKPITSEDTTSHSWSDPSVTSATASTAAATAVNGSDDVGRTGTDQPIVDGPLLCSDSLVEGVEGHTAPMPHAVPGPSGTHEATPAASDSLTSTAATNTGKPGQFGTGSSQVAEESHDTWPAGALCSKHGSEQKVSTVDIYVLVFRVIGSCLLLGVPHCG